MHVGAQCTVLGNKKKGAKGDLVNMMESVANIYYIYWLSTLFPSTVSIVAQSER